MAYEESEEKQAELAKYAEQAKEKGHPSGRKDKSGWKQEVKERYHYKDTSEKKAELKQYEQQAKLSGESGGLFHKKEAWEKSWKDVGPGKQERAKSEVEKSDRPWQQGYLYRQTGTIGAIGKIVGDWRIERQHVISEKRRAFGASYKKKKGGGTEWKIPSSAKSFNNPLMGGGPSPWSYTTARQPGRPTAAQGPSINPFPAMPFRITPSRGRPMRPISPGSVPMPRVGPPSPFGIRQKRKGHLGHYDPKNIFGLGRL